MATVQATANSVVDAVTTPVAPAEPKEDFVYVTIPDLNMLGWEHPGIGINLQHYGPGTHKVSAAIGQEINARLALYHQSIMNLHQSSPNPAIQKRIRELYGLIG